MDRRRTQALLNLITDAIATARILLLVNYRPEYHHDWGNKTSYTQLRLEPLGEESADEMLSALLGDSAEVAPLKQMIIATTAGNPFFVEETIQALFEDGVLTRNGQVKVAKSLSQLRIPPTVQAILASRIDHLPTDEKQLLQTAAVIGKVFGLKLIAEVTAKTEAELIPMLSELESREFIFEEVGAGDIEYSFKHALIQEVAYNSVLIERRKAQHERVGAAIETLWTASLDDHLSELANHYGRSANSLKAVDSLIRAADWAFAHSAYKEAGEHIKNAFTRIGESARIAAPTA